MARGTRLTLVIAAAYGVLLVVGAFVAPLYQGSSSDGAVTSASLVDVNGTWGGVVAAIPLVVTVLVTGLLVLAARHRSALVAAWVVIGLFGAFTLLGMLTIGIFLLPVVALLALAAALASGPSPGRTAAPAPGLPTAR